MKTLGRLFSILALALLGTPALTEEAPWATYTHEKEAFSIQYPSDWEAREDVTYELFKIPFLAIRPLEGENDTFRENLNVVTEKVAKDLTLSAYFKVSLKAMPKGLKDYKKVKEGALAGGKAPSLYLVYTPAYVVTCTSSPVRFDRYWGLFQRIGKGFDP
jgi:hypothetical protein